MLAQKVNIAVVPLVRNTYDVEEGRQAYLREISFLNKFKHIWLITPSDVIEDLESLSDFIRTMRADGVDGIIIMSATFHLGEVALALSSEFPETPFLCWALPEPPYLGNRVRLNSLVGAHLDFCNLYKSGKDNVVFVYGSLETKRFQKELSMWLNALRVLKGWKGSKIAIIGGTAKSFIDVDTYEPNLFSEFGVMVEHIPLDVIFKYDPPSDKVESVKSEYRKHYDFDPGMSEEKLVKVAKLAVTLNDFSKHYGYSALAIRCWPEFAAYYGIAPCAAMSYNIAKGAVMACEGDVGGALTMLAFKSVGCKQIFLADVSQILEGEKALLLWHCGVAPHNLWDKKSRKTLDTYFARGKGVTVGFVLKPGLVTIARVDYIRGRWKVFVTRGKAMLTEQNLKGTYVKVNVGDPLNFVKTLVSKGFAHHVVMAYGDYVDLLKCVARLKGWEIHEPENEVGKI